MPNGAEVYTGDLTYYNPALGACGIDSTDNDAVVAVSHLTFDAIQTGSDPNQNPLCGRKIRARRFNEKTGQSVSIDVTVIDRCKCSKVCYTDERWSEKRIVVIIPASMLTKQ